MPWKLPCPRLIIFSLKTQNSKKNGKKKKFRTRAEAPSLLLAPFPTSVSSEPPLDSLNKNVSWMTAMTYKASYSVSSVNDFERRKASRLQRRHLYWTLHVMRFKTEPNVLHCFNSAPRRNDRRIKYLINRQQVWQLIKNKVEWSRNKTLWHSSLLQS